MTKHRRTYFNNRAARKEYNDANAELYYTNPVYIKVIIEQVLKDAPHLANLVWHDVCAADGRWATILKEYNIRCISTDLHPRSPLVEQKDMYTIWPNPTVLYFGNLPFSHFRKVYKHFANCHRLFFGGASLNKLPGINYHCYNPPWKRPPCFKRIDGSTYFADHIINYSRPHEPPVSNVLVDGYTRKALPNKLDFMATGWTEYILMDERHKELRLD